MPVGSHKDAFKAHQLVKKLAGHGVNAILANLAQEILLDFVKNARQVNAEHFVSELPPDSTSYDLEKCDRALDAVEALCGKCDESHDDNCFVNQARRVLIKIKTNVDLGSAFDGKKSLEDLLGEAKEIAKHQNMAAAPTVAADSAPTRTEDTLHKEPSMSAGLGTQVTMLEYHFLELKEKDLFRSTLIDEIVATIATVAAGNFAAAMPVHDDEQLGKLATAFNLMLGTVNSTMRHLDSLVAERSANLRRIMDTVPVGLLSLDEQLRVHPEYAKSCETILGVKDLRGRHFADLIGLTKSHEKERAKLDEFLDLLRDRALPEEDMAPLNPVEEWQLPERISETIQGEPLTGIDRRSRQRNRSGPWLRTHFHLIDRGTERPHLLVTLEDITRTKEMAAEIVKADRENMQLKAIAEDPDLFCDFLVEARSMIAKVGERLAAIAGTADPRPFINEMFRGVHTIKGTGAALGLDSVSRLAAGLEDEFSRFREAATIDRGLMTAAGSALAELKNAIEEVVVRTAKLLGQSIGSSDDITLRVSARTLSTFMEEVKGMMIPAIEKAAILAELRGFRFVPARKGLGRSLRIIPGLIERLGKLVVFNTEGLETRLDITMAQELNTPLVHLFRNALDHGIEPPAEREAAGKPAEAELSLLIGEDNGIIELRVRDDGRGLDPVRLREKAVSRGLLTEAEAQSLDTAASCELIFLPGFSTAEAVSDVSGRGVGMDAVIASVRDNLHGTITIESAKGKGTTFIMRIPAA